MGGHYEQGRSEFFEGHGVFVVSAGGEGAEVSHGGGAGADLDGGAEEGYGAGRGIFLAADAGASAGAKELSERAQGIWP